MWWQIFFVPFDYYCPLWLFLSRCQSWSTSPLHTATLAAAFCEYCKISLSSCWTLLDEKPQIAQSLLLNTAGWEVTDLVLVCFLWLSQKKLKEKVYFLLPLPGRISSPRDLGPELKVGCEIRNWRRADGEMLYTGLPLDLLTLPEWPAQG